MVRANFDADIASWLSSPTTAAFVRNLDLGADAVVGRVLQRGASTTVESTTFRVVLIKNSDMPGGYQILTGYPTL